MARLNLDLLVKPVATVQTHIGTVYLYRLRVSDMNALAQIPDGRSEDRLRAFLPNVASLSEARGLNDARPPLSAQEVTLLSDDEMECIAERYAETMLQTTRRDGAPPRPQRQDGERVTEFLNRLLSDEVAVQSQQLKDLREKMISPSSGLFAGVRASAATLGSTLNAFDRLTARTLTPETVAPSFEHVDVLARQFQRQARERAEELEMVRLTGQMTAQSAQTLKSLAEAATVLLEQMDARDKRTDDATRTQINVAVWAVAISAFLAMLSLLVSGFAYMQDRASNESGDLWQKQLVEALREGRVASERAAREVQSLRSEVEVWKRPVKESGASASAVRRAND